MNETPHESVPSVAPASAAGLRARVRETVARCLNTPPDELSPDLNLVDEFHINSMQVLGIMVALEKEFDLYVPEEEFTEFGSLRDITALVERLLAAPPDPGPLPPTDARPE